MPDDFTPIVNPNTGGTISKPDDFTPFDLKQGPPTGKPTKYDLDKPLSNVLDFLRPFVDATGATVSGAGAAMIPLAGQNPVVPFAAEVGGYALTDKLMNMLKPIQDSPAGQQNEGVSDSIKDGLINAVGTRIIGGIWNVGKAMNSAGVPEIYKFAPTTSQALEAYGHHALATSAKFAEDFGAADAKAKALDKAGGAGFTQALQFSNALNGRMASTNVDPVKLADKVRETLEQGLAPSGLSTVSGKPYQTHIASEDALDILSGGQNPFQKLDDVIQDPDRLGKVLAAGQLQGKAGLNVRKDLQAYQFMRMVNSAATRDAQGNVTRLDPSKLTKIWNDPEMSTSLNTLYGKQGMQDVRDFIQNVAYTQDKQGTYPIAKQLRYLGSGFTLGSALLSGNMHLAAGTAGTIAGIYIPTAVMGKLLTNPTTAKIVTKLAANSPLDASAQYISRALASALQGSNIAILDHQGNKQWGGLQKNDSGDFTFSPNK